MGTVLLAVASANVHMYWLNILAVVQTDRQTEHKPECHLHLTSDNSRKSISVTNPQTRINCTRHEAD